MMEDIDLRIAAPHNKTQEQGIFSVAICWWPTLSCFGGCHQAL